MTQDDTTQMLGSIPTNSPAHRLLVESMTRLRDNATSEEDERLYDDILKGRRSARDVLSSPGFTRLASQGFQRYTEARADLSDDERDDIDERDAARAQTLLEPEDQP